MATDKEVARILAMVAAAYPNYTLTKETAQVYARLLADVPVEALQAAAMQHTTQSKWFPAVAELRDIAFGFMSGANDIPTALEAWAEVKREVMHEHVAKFSHPLVKRAVDTLGGLSAYGQSDIDDEASWRARFVQSYEELRGRAMRNVTMLPEVREASERLRLSDGAQRVTAMLAEVAGKRGIA